MKNTFFKTNLFLLILISNFIFSQTPQQKSYIASKTDTKKLIEISKEFKIDFDNKRNETLMLAASNGWPIRKNNADGSFSELIGHEGNVPLYYSTYNIEAAQMSGINSLNTGGESQLNLDGQNMIVYMWDQDAPFISHNDFNQRVLIQDADLSTPVREHSTHVMGTMVGSGSGDPRARGMAPLATGVAFNWLGDYNEMSYEAGFSMIVSNHSYGFQSSGLPEWRFGAYDESARRIDEISYAAPYYLSVHAAGNDGNNSSINPSKGGYDLLNANKIAKNALVVAAANYSIDNFSIANFSSKGPTDDNRVKPDITANGVGVFSTSVIGVSPNQSQSFSTLNGTSMASPVVSSGILLLQQHYSNLNSGNFMKSSTVRGLVCHTAKDAGALGPDPIFGWGIFNAKEAANLITGMSSGQSVIEERNFVQTPLPVKYSRFVTAANNNKPLIVSLCWTDVPGVASGSQDIDSKTPKLVHDLDLRIFKDGVEFFPWKLGSTYQSLAEKGDNNVDNIEKIEIPNAQGIYEIVVSYKNATFQNSNQNQDYSLIVSNIGAALNSGFNNVQEFRLFPNPASSSLTVNLVNEIQIDSFEIEVYDLQGRMMLDKKSEISNNSLIIDISSLIQGVYILKIKSSNNYKTLKFVKK